MLSKCVQVKLLAPGTAGLLARPFAPDTTDRRRFPSRIRLEASLLGTPLGALDIAGKDGVGRIRALSLRRGCSYALVATRLLEEAERVARIASWSLLEWVLPPEDASLRAKAQRRGFTAVGNGRLQKTLSG